MYICGTVGFRPIDAADLEILRALHNDATTLLQLGNADMVSSEEQVIWWKGLVNNERSKRFTLLECPSDRIVGMIRIQNIEQLNRNCEVGLDILPPLRGQGFGKAGYRAVLEYLFLHNNMHLVYLKVGDFNDRAVHLYEDLGFIRTGYFKEYLYRHGKYWNYNLMCMTKSDFLAREVETGKAK